MKGIIIVSNTALLDHPNLIDSLSTQCEKVIQEDEQTLFFAKDGVLMTMICSLLDNEVLYTLKFESDSVLKK